MPWVLAASITKVPAVVVTGRPSIENAICFCSAIAVSHNEKPILTSGATLLVGPEGPIPQPLNCRSLLESSIRLLTVFPSKIGIRFPNCPTLVCRRQDVSTFVGALSVEVVLEFVAPFLDDTNGRQRRGIAQWTEGAAEHVFRELVNQRDIFRATSAFMETVEHFSQPGCTLATRNAPAAGFMRVEMHDAASHIHHASVFVHYDVAAGTEHGADFRNRIVVHGDVDFVGAEQWAGTAARDYGFQFFPITHAARYFFDQAAQGKAQRKLVNSRAIHVTRNRIEACAAVFGSSQACVPVAALANDRRYGAKRLGVIDYGGAPIESNDSRKRGANARVAALPFKRFHQRGFLAALISAGTRMRAKFEIKTAVANIFAEVALRVSLREGSIHDVNDVAILAANIYEAAIRRDGATCDHHALDQLMWIHFHQRAILAGSWLAFVGIAEDVFGPVIALGNEAPFHAGRKTCAAAAA